MVESDDPKGGYYTLGFATDEAYERFAAADCPEMRAIIDVLRIDPFPEDSGGMKCRIPDDAPGNPYFVAWNIANGTLYKVAYGVLWNPRRVVVTSAGAQPLPELEVGGPL